MAHTQGMSTTRRRNGAAVTATKTPSGGARKDDEVKPIVLFALEPRSYSEAIGQTIAQLRPELDVLVVKPEDLVSEIARHAPALVFCGEPRPDGCDEVVRWARFRPYDEPGVVRVDGRAERFPGLGIEDVLGLVDRFAG